MSQDGGYDGDDEGYDREVIERALRRLNILEYAILGGAALLALLGGAVTAWVLSAVVEVSFRMAWLVASILLFVIPGGVVYARDNVTTGPPGKGSNEGG